MHAKLNCILEFRKYMNQHYHMSTRKPVVTPHSHFDMHLWKGSAFHDHSKPLAST